MNRRACTPCAAARGWLAWIIAIPALALSLSAQGAPQAPAGGAEVSVRDALQRYATALETLDAEEVKKVHPAIPVATLARAFRDMRELEVTIDTVRVLSLDGTIARVSCRVTQTLTPVAGARQTTAVTRVVRLRRDPDGWVIDTFER